MPIWPSTMHEPVAGSLSPVPRPNVTEAPTDVGVAPSRRRYTSRLIDYSARLYLSEVLRKELDDFHHLDCADGALRFTMPDWIGGAIINCKWNAPPQPSQAGPSGRWYVDVSFVKIE